MKLEDLSPNPFTQFQIWFEQAEKESGLEYPNAMSLATVSAEGRPSVRVVLLKGWSAEGFVFFTNYESRKGRELQQSPWAALCFHWEKLGYQVRIEGKTQRLSKEESLAYFHTRPRDSQIGAWASPQSQEIPSRAFLDQKVEETNHRFQNEEQIPLPPHWGGFCLVPDRMEFWKNGVYRLHDRFLYRRLEGDQWSACRLAP